MASIYHAPNGLRSVQVYLDSGDRRSLRLGRVTKKQAESVKGFVEHLVTAKATGNAPDLFTSKWLASLGDKMYERVVALGLAEPRKKRELWTIEEAYTAMCSHRKDVKQRTRSVWKQAYQSLCAYFGASRRIDSLKPTDGEDWHQYLVSKGYAGPTIRKRICNAKMILSHAVERGHLESNPFTRLKSNPVAGKQKPYVTVSDAEAVIAELPDAHWRLIFALGRFAGLRVFSEGLSLKWSNVDFDKQRIRVPVPKLEHLGKGWRTIPIFKALEPYLMDAYATAEEGNDTMVQINGATDTHVRRIVEKAIERAGLTPWASLFNSLRASCETDLMQDHPLHVVCRWIGHSTKVAEQHYLQVTDEHYERACSSHDRTERQSKSIGESVSNRTESPGYEPSSGEPLEKPRKRDEALVAGGSGQSRRGYSASGDS